MQNLKLCLFDEHDKVVAQSYFAQAGTDFVVCCTSGGTLVLGHSGKRRLHASLILTLATVSLWLASCSGDAAE